MYSRYVPPKKSQPTIHSAESPAPTPLAAKPFSTSQDVSSTYTRYVPSKPKVKATTALVADTIEAQPRKKRRKAEVATEEHVAAASGPARVPAAHDDIDHTTSPKQPCSKKDAEAKAETHCEGSPDPSIMKYSRHHRLMEKREKSLKRAEKVAKKAAKRAAAEKDGGDDEVFPDAPEESHDLVPLPQPEPVPDAPIQSPTASLPTWLASPIRVSPTATANFKTLGVQSEVRDVLRKKGFENAFAVQAAVLPLLLPGTSQSRGDILVSAATGSGKTLAYILPMIEDISKRSVTNLRGLIIMPTRELVAQAREVCEVFAGAFSTKNSASGKRRVNIGTAVGSEKFKVEQASLVEQELHYDPQTYNEQVRKLNRKWETSDIESDLDNDVLCDDEELSDLPYHVTKTVSKVDILICTPGRLVEHLKSTPGFTLEYVKWLVVDEADKLLGQSFQQWLDVVVGRLGPETSPTSKPNANRIRKVILSATMTRDLGQLSSLKLYRPRLVVLEGSSGESGDPENAHANVLPQLLIEAAIKVDEEALKPLYLIELIRRESLHSEISLPISYSPSEGSSSSEDELDSDTSDSDGSKSDESSVTSQDSQATSGELSKIAEQEANTARGILIFTKSNENAVRLGRLLGLIDSSYSSSVGILTSSTSTSSRRKTISSFNAGKLSILVASDLVSRGLDLPNLAHVVNYDIPSSVTNYVHRVGRTARAGRKGWAWTMFTSTEGRWFWQEIARSLAIVRKADIKVSRVNIDAKTFDKELRGRYEAALEALGQEARRSNVHRSEEQKA